MMARSPSAAAPWGVTAALEDDRDSELMTGEAVGLDVRPAGFVLRGAGAAIDWIVYVGLFLALLALIQLVANASGDQSLTTALVIASLVISLVIAPMSVEILTRGRSLGKLAVGARIVRDDGGAAQTRHAFIRALTGVLELYLTLGGIAALVGLLSPRSKRLGDLLAGTYSQHERVPHVVQPVYGVPPALAGWARTADVAKLPDRLSRRIAAFLRQAGAMTPAARYGIAAELAQEAAAYVSPLPATSAELFLAAVSAVRRDRDFNALTLERRRLEGVDAVLTGLPHAFPDR
ncbi:RDD family protein [Rathayibacter soli]|uniref:RDD family protein n=1 Tax=Rathayibacter soli TaxID=3144168 RepID=UPI0027E43FF7|nr:RDD family protein [Glaciibacter superstes]